MLILNVGEGLTGRRSDNKDQRETGEDRGLE